MRFFHPFFGALALAVFATGAQAQSLFDMFPLGERGRLERVNRKLGGRVLDYSNDHGRDNRIWSPSLNQWRNLFVYLPPGYDGTAQFPVMMWLHGINQTHKDFLQIVHHFDEGIRAGKFPPVVIVAPDGSVRSRLSVQTIGSFYMNSKAGDFESYILNDIWAWALKSFAIRPEREAHVIAGASMGGFGSYNLAFKHHEQFGNIAGIMPALDTQYMDCHGRHFADYDPNCVGRRDVFRRNQVVGRFYGVILVRQRRMLDVLFGRFGTADIETIRRNNPLEMLAIHDVQPHDYKMFIAYPTEDEFNIDAQVEHFIDVARRRGIQPTVEKMVGLHHTVADGIKAFPALSRWMLPLLAPYAPSNYRPMQTCRSEIQLQPFTTASIRPLYLSPLPTSPGTLALR